MARRLEQSLLPPELPYVPGLELAARFHPAGGGGQVGGDFYDVFTTGSGGWAIAVGDVFGRGIDAAAVTMLARHTLRAAAIKERTPSRILAILNEALRSQLDELRICSAAVAVLSPPNGNLELTLASAGHPLPLLLRAGEVESIGTNGTLLGVVESPEIVDYDLALAPGDTLVFYTNGVSDVRAGYSRFGLEELMELVGTCSELSASETAACIDDAVRDAQGTGSLDDAVILAARVAEQS